jgi:2-methylcitrate dehydratase
VREFDIHTHSSAEGLAREDQLAWALAELAAEPTPTDPDVADMVVNRVLDNAAVAAAALARRPVVVARQQARHFPASPGATVMGDPVTHRVSPAWAAWANGAAVRELDFHDTFLSEEWSHPGDNIPALIAVAQHVATRRGVDGVDLVRGIAVAYEVQISLCRAMSLHRHRIDHIAHLGPSIAAGLGSILRLEPDVIYHAIGQALHTTTQTRQSRKGTISTWKGVAPGFAGKVAVEALDRALRGETAPAPIYEGDDGVLAWLLDGPNAHYTVRLAEPGEPRREILASYTKEHSAEYQAQAWIDLARRWFVEHPGLANPERVESVTIYTSYHTHHVIGSGSGDPEKYDPEATRETLDHSLPYIFTVAWQDGSFHHETSYHPERARRPDTVALWRTVTTVEDPEWTRRYLSHDDREKAFGGRIEVRLRDGTRLVDEIAVADAHPLGARPFARAQYVAKLRQLAASTVDDAEVARFIDRTESLGELAGSQLGELNLVAREELRIAERPSEGIF